MSEFCESIQIVHEQNYSYAAYLSLTSSEKVDANHFNEIDVAEVMKTLEFVKVGQVTVGLDPPADQNVTLLSMFESILHPFPNNNNCFYLDNKVSDGDFSPTVDESLDSAGNSSDLDDADEEQQSVGSHRPGFFNEQNLNEIDDAMSDVDATHGFVASAPKFVRFLLNDAPLTTENVDQIKKDSVVSVLISIFKEKSSQTRTLVDVDMSRLPFSHSASGTTLSFLLNAYVSEVTLNRLRFSGSILHDVVIQAKQCMRKARNILTCTVNLFFYSRSSDAIVKASEKQLLGLEVDVAFDFLVTELKKNREFALKSFDSDSGFLLECMESGSNVLSHWCFLKMQTVEGAVYVEVYHPIGLEKAFETIEHVIDDITSCCHRVNQLLLLLSLNNTRLASKLLIPDISDNSLLETNAAMSAEIPFQDGHFECPVAYETSFKLFHRLAANPMKVVRSLETYVLQNFAVSNRPEVFVYKDEYGSIFYMKLAVQEPKSVTKDNKTSIGPGYIDFVVFGIGVPGSSITEQLRKLLHKHLLSIAVEMLTTVLTKNPRFHWRQLDIRFIQSFYAQANNLNETTASAIGNCKTYKFPVSTYDPGMVALFFRQNLCGSTFFHPLLSSDWESSQTNDELTASHRNNMQLQPTDLVFFYNALSSDLDPSLQSESTLTAKGSRYSAQTGTGLAIIEISMLNRNGHPLHNMMAAIPARDVDDTKPSSIQSLTFSEAVDKYDDGDGSNDTPIYIRVSIADTALKTDVLHDWILLSMNQAIAAWNVERQLERIQNGLKSSFFIPFPDQAGRDNKLAMEKVCPGLPILVGILEHAQKLPDPTALIEEYDGIVRSSTVASVALDLLEKIVLDQIQATMRSRLSPDKHYKLVIFRSSRTSSPLIVTLERDSSGRVTVRGANQSTPSPPIIDSPIDCPEYTIFFHSPDYSTWNDSNQIVAYPKLFKEVAVGYEKSTEKGEFAKLLFDFKQHNASLFRRSIAFVFNVKRNRRRLLAYNWNNALFRRTTKRLAEMEGVLQKSNIKSAQFLNYRCLGVLSPVPTFNAALTVIPKVPVQASSAKVNVPSDVDRSSATRPPALPPTIRRPKLVGKSIEGSAVHAQAKSRARASATRFKGVTQSTTPTTHRKQNSATSAARSSSKIDNVGVNASTGMSNLAGIHNGNRSVESSDEFHHIRNEFERSFRHTTNQRTVRFVTSQELTKKYWPQKSGNISESLAAFIFSMAPISWIDVSTMLPYPTFQEEDFLHSFGNTLITCHPELSVVRGANTPGIYWVTGKLRSLKTCRGFVAVKIAVTRCQGDGKDKGMVNLEGRLLTMPVQSKSSQNWFATIENVSAGLDRLACDIRRFLELQGQLLDHCAFMIERTMKSLATANEYNDAVSILRPLIELFPLHTIVKSIRSNYKVT